MIGDKSSICVNCTRDIEHVRTLTGPLFKNGRVEVWTHLDTGWAPCDQAADGIDRWPDDTPGRQYAVPFYKTMEPVQ